MGQSQSKRMDKYVATYERAFERIETDLVRVLQRRDSQRAWRQALALWTAIAVVVSAVVAAWLVQRVQQAPMGTYTVGEHAARTSAGLALPFAVAALRWLLLLLLGAADARACSRVAALEAAKRALVRELKDACRFDTARRLLARYDPDERKAQQQQQALQQQQQQQQLQQQRRRAAQLMAQQHPDQPPPPRALNHPNNPTGGQSPQLLATAGAAAASAVAGAGRAVLPLIDRLATTLIADNPVLLEDVRQARAALAEAGAVAAGLERENEALRARVAELEGLLGFGGGGGRLPLSEGGGGGAEAAEEAAPVAEEAAARRETEDEREEEATVAAAAGIGGKGGGDEPGKAVELAATANGGGGGGGGGNGPRQRRRNAAKEH